MNQPVDLPESRSPGPIDLTVLFACILGFWTLVRLVSDHHMFSTPVSLGFVAACGGLVGLPALAWSLDAGRGRLEFMVIVGAIAGALPPVILVLTGALGLLLYGPPTYVRQALGYAANIPAHGVYPWPAYFLMVAETIAVGMLTATAVWAVNSRLRRR